MKFLRILFNGLKVIIYYRPWMGSKTCQVYWIFKVPFKSISTSQNHMFLQHTTIISKLKPTICNSRQLLIIGSSFLMFSWGCWGQWMMWRFYAHPQSITRLPREIYLMITIYMMASNRMWLKIKAIHCFCGWWYHISR